MSNEFVNIGSANSSPEHFQLRYISISKYEGDWQSLPHTHHFSELFYVLRGEGAFYIENEKVPVKTDDLVIINPYVEHTEKTLPNDPMEYIVFGVDCIFRKNRALAPHERSAVPLGTDHCPVG